jgi:hypothetical protein
MAMAAREQKIADRMTGAHAYKYKITKVPEQVSTLSLECYDDYSPSLADHFQQPGDSSQRPSFEMSS